MAKSKVSRHATKAVQEIWDDLTDRRGIKWELQGCDQDIKREIRRKLATIIQKAIDGANRDAD